MFYPVLYKDNKFSTISDNEFQKMFAAGMLREISEDMKENYFVLREPEKYTEEMGLPLDIEYGQAVMF